MCTFIWMFLFFFFLQGLTGPAGDPGPDGLLGQKVSDQ